MKPVTTKSPDGKVCPTRVINKYSAQWDEWEPPFLVRKRAKHNNTHRQPDMVLSDRIIRGETYMTFECGCVPFGAYDYKVHDKVCQGYKYISASAMPSMAWWRDTALKVLEIILEALLWVAETAFTMVAQLIVDIDSKYRVTELVGTALFVGWKTGNAVNIVVSIIISILVFGVKR